MQNEGKLPNHLGRRRLFFDIETSPNIGLFWSAGYKQRIDYDNIIKERAIICICYKWENEKMIHSLKWDKQQCDKKMLQEFIKVANHATEMIAHNGDKFDLAWIRTRCIHHGIPMFPQYTTIDTLKIARSKFRFNSNRLDYIGKYLGIGQKIHTDFNLWKEIVLNNCTKSMTKMIDYCKQDVSLLEKVYRVMKMHVHNKTHYGVMFNQDRGTCKECGSDDLMANGTRITAAGTRYLRYQCRSCGHYNQKLA